MKYFFSVIYFCIAWNIVLSADPILTFFFRPYPVDTKMANEIMQKLKNPKSLSRHDFSEFTDLDLVSGIFSTYFGYIQASNANGQTIFPRKQSNTKLSLVISNKITPILMFQNTISHWELEPGVDVEVFNAEQIEDTNTQLVYWNVEKVPAPENNQISPENSIVIIAKPKNVYVPTGISLTSKEPNLVLPDIYIKKGIQSLRNALYMVNLTPFFRPSNVLYKQGPAFYGTLIAE